jgi:hypothetical protein
VIVMVATMIVHGHAVDHDLGDHHGGDRDVATIMVATMIVLQRWPPH